jgi:hypothetical protein
MNEDRYETLDMIVKVRPDGQSWFDVISDLITENCEGDPEVEGSCTCGLESMGGSSGTLDQCYRRQGIADDLVGPVDKTDLLRVLRAPAIITACSYDPELLEVCSRLMKECTWWDETLERWAEEEEEEEDWDE